MSDIIKKGDEPGGFTLSKGKLTATTSSFKRRISEAKIVMNELPNRLALFLDKSGSMRDLVEIHNNYRQNKTKLDLLKEAVENFANRCNPGDTALALRTFPPSFDVELTNILIVITDAVKSLQDGGGTPMRECLQKNSSMEITRAIIVSDGEATDWGYDNREEGTSYTVLNPYIERKIPIDCVHIGDSSAGEERLRKIAELTGGLYIKFTDVSAFSTAFAYLTPGYRAMLTDGSVDAAKLGAKEIR